MRYDPATERLLATVYFNTGQASTFEEVKFVDRPGQSSDPRLAPGSDYAIVQENRETLIPAHSIQRVVVQREKRP